MPRAPPELSRRADPGANPPGEHKPRSDLHLATARSVPCGAVWCDAMRRCAVQGAEMHGWGAKSARCGEAQLRQQRSPRLGSGRSLLALPVPASGRSPPPFVARLHIHAPIAHSTRSERPLGRQGRAHGGARLGAESQAKGRSAAQKMDPRDGAEGRSWSSESNQNRGPELVLGIEPESRAGAGPRNRTRIKGRSWSSESNQNRGPELVLGIEQGSSSRQWSLAARTAACGSSRKAVSSDDSACVYTSVQRSDDSASKSAARGAASAAESADLRASFSDVVAAACQRSNHTGQGHLASLPLLISQLCQGYVSVRGMQGGSPRRLLTPSWRR